MAICRAMRVVTEGKVHEIQVARKLKLRERHDAGYSIGVTPTMNGSCDLTATRRCIFVTRLKDNAAYLVVDTP